jgi:peptide/nickel transport system permease protein
MEEKKVNIQVKTAVEKPRSPLADFVKRLVREKPLGVAGAVIVLVLLFGGTFADYISPYKYDEVQITERMQAPSSQHLLGTDNLGRDQLSRIIYGARVSLYIGLGASALNVLLATVLGVISGYLGGTFDIILQRIIDTAVIFPMILILLSLMSIVGAGYAQLILVLGLWGGIGWIRLVRSAVMSIKGNIYIDSAKSIGGSTAHILWHHVIPNIMPTLIIIFSISIAGNILGEASLSFLGFGLPPAVPSWGGMLTGNGRQYMYSAPWLAIWPGVALSIAVYGVNMWGDAVRDLLDPKLKGGVGGYDRKNNAKKIQSFLKRRGVSKD